MLDPAPTTTIDPSLARGILEERIAATALKPEMVVLSFHNTDYQIHLLPIGDIEPGFGGKVVGTIRGEARRVDECGTGGRYVEPVIGRPRRVQGRIIGIDGAKGTILVDAGIPMHFRLTAPGQTTGDFEVGQFVTFGVARGATFEQA